MAEADTLTAFIPASSKRQVMDWSLVLASQNIPSTIVQSPDGGWGLAVEPGDYERALESIRLYHLENRRWQWRQPIPWSDATFHWGALGWCFMLVLVYWLVENRVPDFWSAGRFDSRLVAEGQWWRAFTAILLHADLAHLLANVTSGFILLGLAMARFGPGPGLLGAYLAGAAGNGFGFMLRSDAYFGLGASGMIMGALGLISISPYLQRPARPHSLKQLTQAVFAGVLLFLLLGVSPSSDVVAHLGGFLAGLVLGTGLALLPERILRNRIFIGGAWLFFFILVTLTTGLALSHP